MVLSYQQAQISMFNVKIDPQLKKYRIFKIHTASLFEKKNVIHCDRPLGGYAHRTATKSLFLIVLLPVNI